MEDIKAKWDQIYTASDDQFPEPCTVLKEYAYLLPDSGTALDLACGKGANALLLAAAGLTTTAVDISPKAIEIVEGEAARRNLTINTRATGIEEVLATSDDCYDVVVVCRFLERSLLSGIAGLLKENGLLFYQTFVKEKSDDSVGPSNPDYLLNANELLLYSQKLQIRAFSDLGNAGNSAYGFRNESWVVAQRITRS